MPDSHLRPVINAMPLPVLLIDAVERVQISNGLAQQVLGTDGQGRHYITALRQPGVLDAIETTLKDGGRRMTTYLGNEGGRDTVWRVTVAGVPLSQGIGALLTFEDITEVEQAGLMRRDFVANVSHELRTPLTALLGFIETLQGAAQNDPDARERFLCIMAKEAGRMSRLVEDLLSLSRVEEEERVRPTDDVDLGGLLQSCVLSLQPLAERSEVEVTLDVPDADIVVRGDEGQLRQVITNLIENAIKYGGQGDRIEVSLNSPEHEVTLRDLGVRVSVRDYGEGIPSHHIARLTERFYRVDTHRSREIGGTGLGLAIVKHIINRHRGRLRVESEIGKGSRFTVILPLT